MTPSSNYQKLERGEKERERERRVEQARPVESGFFLTWVKMNGPQFVALVHKSLKIVIAIYHESAGCNFIFNGWNFQRDPPLFSIRRDLPVIRNANRVQSFWQLRPSPRELSLSNRRRERKREKITVNFTRPSEIYLYKI